MAQGAFLDKNESGFGFGASTLRSQAYGEAQYAGILNFGYSISGGFDIQGSYGPIFNSSVKRVSNIWSIGGTAHILKESNKPIGLAATLAYSKQDNTVNGLALDITHFGLSIYRTVLGTPQDKKILLSTHASYNQSHLGWVDNFPVIGMAIDFVRKTPKGSLITFGPHISYNLDRNIATYGIGISLIRSH